MTYLTNQTKEKDDDVVAQTTQLFSELLTLHSIFKVGFHKISQLNKRSNIIIIIIVGVWYV